MICWALIRYVAGDAVRAQRWVAPPVPFLVLTVTGTALGGTARGGYGFTITAIFPVAVWLTVAVLNSEDPIQMRITTATVGSLFRVRIAKLVVAYAGCQILAVIGVVWPLLTGHPASRSDVFAGVMGHGLSSLAAVAWGSLLGRPVLQAPAWAVVLGISAFLLEILVPGFPPVRPLAVSFSDASGVTPSGAGVLAQVAVETIVGAAVLTGLGHLLARRRS